MRSSLLLLVPAVAMVSSVAEAAQTGAVRGKVSDDSGAAVAGATITIKGPNIAGEITVESDADGNFRFLALPPGQHIMTVSKPGFAPTRYNVGVRIDQSSFVPVVLQMSEGGEEIVIEETLPVIDSTSSSVSTQLSADLIQNVPTGRSYQDVINTVAGVSGRVDTQNGGPGNGNPSVRGEGQYGNNYMLDGISTRDPATKTFGSDVNFDAIEEIQVYTDGAPAEYGQATGMLVNVVTKDGGDEHHGSVGYYFSTAASGGQYDILDLETHQEVATDKRKFNTHELSLTAGGPVVKEKLWYFAAADISRSHIQFEGVDPDAPYNQLGGDGFAKLTWFVLPELTMQYQFGYGRNSITNYETSGLYAAEAQARYNNQQLTHIFTTRWRPSAKGELELKLSMLNNSIDVVPMSNDEETASIYDLDTGSYIQNYDSFDYNDRARMGGALTYTQLIDNFAGDHEWKIGTEVWNLTDQRELVFTGAGDGYQYTRYESAGYPCTAEADYQDCYHYTEYVAAGALGHRGLVFGGFIQDDWQPVDPLTLNLGFRIDKEQLYQNEGDLIVSEWMPAPRLGAAWDITNDSKTVFTVNAGRYYDLNGNTFADWGDTRSAFVFREYDVDPSTGEYYLSWEQDPATDPLIYCTDQSLAALDDPDIKAAAEAACGDTRLKPYHMDKLVVGLEREIVPLFAIGVKGIMSRTRDLPEDIDYDLDTWVITNPENKKRDYRALEITAEKKYDGVWQLLASYTLSESMGTSPGQFEIASGGQTGSNGNGVGVFSDDVTDPATREFFFDNGYGWLMDGLAGLGTNNDDAGYYGYLPYDSRHSLKLTGSYTMPWQTTVGAVYEFDSGHAWQKRGYVDLYGDYFSFPEGRGSRHMPAVHYFDMRVAQKIDFSDDVGLEITADIFNLFDLQSPVTYYENDDENFGLTMYRQSPRSIRLGAKLTY